MNKIKTPKLLLTAASAALLASQAAPALAADSNDNLANPVFDSSINQVERTLLPNGCTNLETVRFPNSLSFGYFDLGCGDWLQAATINHIDPDNYLNNLKAGKKIYFEVPEVDEHGVPNIPAYAGSEDGPFVTDLVRRTFAQSYNYKDWDYKVNLPENTLTYNWVGEFPEPSKIKTLPVTLVNKKTKGEKKVNLVINFKNNDSMAIPGFAINNPTPLKKGEKLDVDSLLANTPEVKQGSGNAKILFWYPNATQNIEPDYSPGKHKFVVNIVSHMELDDPAFKGDPYTKHDIVQPIGITYTVEGDPAKPDSKPNVPSTPNKPKVEEKTAFSDIATYPFAKEINWLASTGITTGYPDGTFAPNESVSRAALAAFIYRMEGSPEFKAPEKSPFTDVRPEEPFYKEICWLASKGITTGYKDGSFKPWNYITRDAMAAFLHRYDSKVATTKVAVKGQAKDFNDIAKTPFGKDIAWLSSTGITTGYSDGSFRPFDNIERGAIAAFVYRMKH